MKKWEYKILTPRLIDWGNWIDALNAAGEEGWELVAVSKTEDHSSIAYFKREIQ